MNYFSLCLIITTIRRQLSRRCMIFYVGEIRITYYSFLLRYKIFTDLQYTLYTTNNYSTYYTQIVTDKSILTFYSFT